MSSSTSSSIDSQSCDTLKPPTTSLAPTPSTLLHLPPSGLLQPSSRKLCVRHQRIADEGTNLKLQQVCSTYPFVHTVLIVNQALDDLPLEERESINAVWASFSSSPHPRRELILRGILTMCCFSQLSLLTDALSHLIRIDPFVTFPREISLKVLAYLDATSLCRAAQVSRHWKALADDNTLWREICQQHIGTKCAKCGWSLPILEARRLGISVTPSSPSPVAGASSSSKGKRKQEDLAPTSVQKRHHSDPSPSVIPSAQPAPLPLPAPTPTTALIGSTPPNSPSPLSLSFPVEETLTRPWKDVYSERLKIERNWRRGRCSVRTLRGHTNGIMCLQFSETLPHLPFPVLITGSYDRTARVWNLETGEEIRCLRGHTRALRALQFDEVKLVTGSMDHTLRVWNWRTGECIRTLEGHTEGVICLNFSSTVLASGSVDTTIKVWNFCTGECFTLRGHRDWVNAVLLWDPTPGSSLSVPDASSQHVAPGKMLFSASDDCSVRLWDLTLRTCVRQFTGHVGQVQSLKLLSLDTGHGEENNRHADASARLAEAGAAITVETPCGIRQSQLLLVSGSLDNTVKVWDIESGKVMRTLFGHIEGVWAVACNDMRLVSGSHDRTIKVKKPCSC